MHDFLLAKEIIEALKKIASEKNIVKARSVDIEIGKITHADHVEDINLENLRFGLKNIARGTVFAGTEFRIEKIAGNNWKITNIEV